MKEQSRIRFSPVTGEIEVAGSEAFVRTYFQKLQRLLSQSPEVKGTKPARPEAGPAEKSKKTKAEPGQRKIGKQTQMETIVSFVRDAEGGITTSTLKEKTGLTERQIWSVVYRAEKQRMIKKMKRGIYVAA